jgi:hypothetical protein
VFSTDSPSRRRGIREVICRGVLYHTYHSGCLGKDGECRRFPGNSINKIPEGKKEKTGEERNEKKERSREGAIAEIAVCGWR